MGMHPAFLFHAGPSDPRTILLTFISFDVYFFLFREIALQETQSKWVSKIYGIRIHVNMVKDHAFGK